jgi:hypothetical protein
MLIINGFSLVINKVILIVFLMIGNFHYTQTCKTIKLDCKTSLIDEISSTSSSTLDTRSSNSIFNCVAVPIDISTTNFENIDSTTSTNSNVTSSTDNLLAERINNELISSPKSTQKTDDFETTSFKETFTQTNSVENSKLTLFLIQQKNLYNIILANITIELVVSNNVTILQLKCESNDDYDNYIFAWNILLEFNETLTEKISATIETQNKENVFNIDLKTSDSINITAKCCVTELITTTIGYILSRFNY